MKKRSRKKQVVKFDPLDPIIVSAVRIVSPTARLRDDFRRAVMSARYSLIDSHERRDSSARMKEKKDAAGTLGAALRRVEAASNNADLPPRLAVNPLTLLKLTQLAERCKEFAKTPAGHRMQEPAS